MPSNKIRVSIRVRKLQLVDQDEAARSAAVGGREKQREGKRSWASKEGETLAAGLGLGKGFDWLA